MTVTRNRLNRYAFYKFFDDSFGPQTAGNANNTAYFMQTLTEMAIAHQVKTLEQKTSANTLILDGGVALNCVNNSKVLANSRFTDVHVGFAANDSGVTIGVNSSRCISFSSGSAWTGRAFSFSPHSRIVRREILPNLMSTLLVKAAIYFGYAINGLGACQTDMDGSSIDTLEDVADRLNYQGQIVQHRPLVQTEPIQMANLQPLRLRYNQ